MAVWKALNEQEEKLARDMGLGSEGIVVNRVGVDQLVFLILKTREEVYVNLGKVRRGK